MHLPFVTHRYYFPAGQVREWIEHQAEREKESAAMEVEHATGRCSDTSEPPLIDARVRHAQSMVLVLLRPVYV